MPRYVVSACLAGHACRYDGGSNACEIVMQLVRRGEALALCPEALAGLPVPRLPCEILGDKVMSKDGRDMSEEFARGAQSALAAALAGGCTVAILKSRSPSCGIKGIYDGTFSKTLTQGMGLWAQALAAHGLKLYSEEEVTEATQQGKPHR